MLTREKVFNIIVILLGLSFVWFFTSIFAYMVIAAVVALIAKPLKNIFQKIKIRKKPINDGIISAFILIIFLALMFASFYLILPILMSQADDLKKLNYNEIYNNIQLAIADFEAQLKSYGVISEDQNLTLLITNYFTAFSENIQVDTLVSSAINAASSVFIGFSTVLFMSFFFIKDERLFTRIILMFIPLEQKTEVSHVLLKIRLLLTRYFVGLLTEVVAMMILISLGGLIIGLKNAILIGVIGGFLNIIPYIGPLIGMVIGAILVTISSISLGVDATLPLVYGILTVFVVANLIDNFLLQPFIYSNSVKAHPLEIFIVIVVGGTLAGVTGMVLAIPLYTILRVVAKEFLGDQEFIKRMIKEI